MNRNTPYGGLKDISNNPGKSYDQQQQEETFKKKYGLDGLLEMLKKNPKEVSIISNGIDLTSFGLDLNGTKEYSYLDL